MNAQDRSVETLSLESFQDVYILNQGGIKLCMMVLQISA